MVCVQPDPFPGFAVQPRQVRHILERQVSDTHYASGISSDACRCLRSQIHIAVLHLRKA